jgi:hypothetical protein
MSFDVEYPNRKDSRKPYYRRAKRMDRTCRNHGSCSRCVADRLHRRRVIEDMMDEAYRDGLDELMAASLP